jgi:hypothetical protein
MAVYFSDVIYKKLYDKEQKHSVDKALNKLAKAIDKQLTKSVTMGYASDMNHRFQVSLNDIRLEGGKITLRSGRKDFIYNIVGEKQLFTDVVKGDALRHVNSYVSLTKNIRFEEIINMTKQFEIEYASALSDITDTNIAQLIEHYFPTYGKVPFDTWKKAYDRSPINIKSLHGWIGWASEQMACAKSQEKKDTFKIQIRQAWHVIGLAEGMGGFLYQERKKGDYFRTYYRGLSVQMMPKHMREAALGHSYQYDINSSATAWLYSYADEYNNSVDTPHSFRTIRHFLEDKKRTSDGLFNEIMRDVFMTHTFIGKNGKTYTHDKTWSMNKIKSIFSAINFGAKLEGVVTPMKDKEGMPILDENGNQKYFITSIGEILKNNELRNAFLNHYLVKEFVEERKILSEFVINKHRDELMNIPVLVKEGRLRKRSALTYMYNGWETDVMAAFRHFVKEYTKDNMEEQRPTLIAKIHDAVIYDKKISPDVLSEVIEKIREGLGFPLFSMSTDKLETYTGNNTEEGRSELRDQAIHKLFVQKQEWAIANGFEVPKNVGEVELSEYSIKTMMASIEANKPKKFKSSENHGVYESVDDSQDDFKPIYEPDEPEPISIKKVEITDEMRVQSLTKLKSKQFGVDEDRASVIMAKIKSKGDN